MTIKPTWLDVLNLKGMKALLKSHEMINRISQDHKANVHPLPQPAHRLSFFWSLSGNIFLKYLQLTVEGFQCNINTSTFGT